VGLLPSAWRPRSPPERAYGDRVSSPSQAPTQPPGSLAPDERPRRKTLWEEGQHPGPLVIRAAVLGLLVVTVASLPFGRIGVAFDVAFVLICLGAALWVRPRDFFSIGVLPPLLLGFVVIVLAVVDRGAVARADDPFVQAVVSGLAHHALALVIGYGLTLAVLALRQVALRHQGSLRPRSAAR
jgi:hypothetical protein